MNRCSVPKKNGEQVIGYNNRCGDYDIIRNGGKTFGRTGTGGNLVAGSTWTCANVTVTATWSVIGVIDHITIALVSNSRGDTFSATRK
jgi:hypothetical protein